MAKGKNKLNSCMYKLKKKSL